MKIIINVILSILPVFCAIWFIEPEVNENVIYVDEGRITEINTGYYLERTSRWVVRLKGNAFVDMFVSSIGWDEKNMVVLRYPHNRYANDVGPDWNNPEYYIVSLEDDTMIGPLTQEEYEESEYTHVELKEINR